MKHKHLYITLLLLLFHLAPKAQGEWVVTPEESKKLSPFVFNDEMKSEGQRIYDNSCTSCHGTPGMNDFAKLSPSPGDPAGTKFQSQTDGSLLHKIKKGRGPMPSFENALGEEEIWNVIAYIRDFNKAYVQTPPPSTGEKVPVLTASLSFDDNTHSLVVKALSDSTPKAGMRITPFVKGRFGNYPLAKTVTNNQGIAYVSTDMDLPADSLGRLVYYVKINDGLASFKITDTLTVAEPNITMSTIEGRHLWSAAGSEPIWLRLTFWTSIIGIWSAIILIVVGLFGLKKIK